MQLLETARILHSLRLSTHTFTYFVSHLSTPRSLPFPCSKKEEKIIRQLRCKITFHEARGGNRQGQVGDKRGHWSPNPEWDAVQELKAQIKMLQENAQKRAWGQDGAKKDLGRNIAKLVRAEEAAKSPAASPASAPVDGDFPPALAI